MMQDKIVTAQQMIFERAGKAPALLCSFGKDSMVLLHLIRATLTGQVPVIYYRFPYFPAKQAFANQIIEKWGLTVHDYPPLACGVKVNDERLELVSRYSFGGNGAFDLPINTEPPISRRDFICGLNDWLLRPKAGAIMFPWDSLFMAHKSSDVDPFEGAVPLKTNSVAIGQAELIFPLRDWTDADVWDYIEENRVPYDKRRYQDRAELPDKWLNPDYIHACTRCIDPREKAKTVFCPKIQGLVRNMGPQVLRLQERPDYIEAAA
jgi:hypothetical protein